MRKTKEFKQFIFYSIYAWGVPFLITIITFLVEFYDIVPETFRPNIGEKSCWFNREYKKYLFKILLNVQAPVFRKQFSWSFGVLSASCWITNFDKYCFVHTDNYTL